MARAVSPAIAQKGQHLFLLRFSRDRFRLIVSYADGIRVVLLNDSRACNS
jgi:hypothetical protein